MNSGRSSPSLHAGRASAQLGMLHAQPGTPNGWRAPLSFVRTRRTEERNLERSTRPGRNHTRAFSGSNDPLCAFAKNAARRRLLRLCVAASAEQGAMVQETGARFFEPPPREPSCRTGTPRTDTAHSVNRPLTRWFGMVSPRHSCFARGSTLVCGRGSDHRPSTAPCCGHVRTWGYGRPHPITQRPTPRAIEP